VGPPEGGRNDRYLALIVKLVPGDLGSPFASKANVVAYERHVLFTSDDPAGATRHRAPDLISTTRIEEAFVHEMPEELVGLVFAQADLAAYACDLGVGVYLVPSTLALLDSPEHGIALVVGKLCRHYAPLPLDPLPIVRLPDRTVTCPLRIASSQATLLCGREEASANFACRVLGSSTLPRWTLRGYLIR
jgi:hypothetical protein